MRFRLFGSGCDLRVALNAARDLGCTIWNPRRSGDVCVAHPSEQKIIRHHASRKDASRALVVFLDRVSRRLGGDDGDAAPSGEITPGPREPRPVPASRRRSWCVQGRIV